MGCEDGTEPVSYTHLDVYKRQNDNMVILLPRYGKKHIIYKDILIKMILRDCIVAVSYTHLGFQ